MLDLLLLALNSALSTISVILVLIVLRELRRRSESDLLSRINAIKREFVNEVKILRGVFERVKDSNVNVLSAIETRLKGLDRVMSSLEERLNSVVMKKSSAVKVVDGLDGLDCIFRDDGLIVYGSYDKEFVAYVTQALRALKDVGLDELSVKRGNTTVHIKALGHRSWTFYCLKESPYPVRFDSEKILKELGGIVGQ